MPTFKRSQNKSAIYSADACENIEAYDLFGEKRQWLECLATLNSKHKDILKSIEFDCIRIFNDHDCKLELSQFSQTQLSNQSNQNNEKQADLNHEQQVESQDNNTKLIWLQASNQLGQQPVLAISYATLYSLTELFLGGQQSNLAKNTKATEVSESELRLLERLLFIHLKALDTNFALENTWQTRLIDPPTRIQPQLSTCACFSVTDFEALWQLWLPQDFVGIPVKISSAVSDQQALSEKLARAAENIPTELNVVLAKTQISLAQLTELASGDVLPIELSEIVNAYAGEQHIAQGKIVDRNGNLVMQVTQDQPLNS